MKLKDEHYKNLRGIFERAGATFEDKTEDEIRQLFNDVADIYVTLAKISLKAHQKAKNGLGSSTEGSRALDDGQHI